MLQFTRDALIQISGAKDKKRDFVYFTDVKNIPSTDLATMERLWNKFSKGKFGYSVQKVRILGRYGYPFGVEKDWKYLTIAHSSVFEFCFFLFTCSLDFFCQRKLRQSKGDFETFCRKVGWTAKDGEVERKKRWFGASEFIYDVKKAPEGHLPLTSALRGTSLFMNLMKHPVWENDDWKKDP